MSKKKEPRKNVSFSDENPKLVFQAEEALEVNIKDARDIQQKIKDARDNINEFYEIIVRDPSSGYVRNGQAAEDLASEIKTLSQLGGELTADDQKILSEFHGADENLKPSTRKAAVAYTKSSENPDRYASLTKQPAIVSHRNRILAKKNSNNLSPLFRESTKENRGIS